MQNMVHNAVDIKVRLPYQKSPSKNPRGFTGLPGLHCEDFSRVDLFLTKKGKIYVNEINTIPGFTNSSMFPMMWKERGISFTDLISKLINLAYERYTANKRIDYDFQSSLKF
jgi:D-alanine-D-alanine ligase